MRYFALGFLLIGIAGLTGSCASVRATGPKSSVDHCVDRCELTAKWCEEPMYPPSGYPTRCDVDYQSCVVRCDQPKSAQTPEQAKM